MDDNFRISPWIKTFVSMVIFAFTVSLVLKEREAAVVLTLLMLIHELGHYFMARWRGVPVSVPIFIPFLGAMINMNEDPASRDEAWIGLGGPLLGGLGCLAGYSLWLTWDGSHEVLFGITLAAFVNSFNMIPVRPLDGGRVAQIVGSWTRYIGLGMFLFVMVASLNPILFVFLLFILPKLRYKQDKVPLSTRVAWTVAYLAVLSLNLFLIGVTLSELVQKQ